MIDIPEPGTAQNSMGAPEMVADFTAEQLNQFGQVPAPMPAVDMKLDEAQTLMDSNNLDLGDGLAPISSVEMPTLDGGDPFATGEFNPDMPGDPNAPAPIVADSSNVLQMPVIDPMPIPDVEPIPAQIDMATGQAVPIQMDAETGKPADIQINPVTGNPVQPQVNQASGEPVQVMMNPEVGIPVQLDPETGKQIAVEVNALGEVAPVAPPVQQIQPAQVAVGQSFSAEGLPNTNITPAEAPPLVNSDELGALGGLPTMPEGGMPEMGSGDPFATASFNPEAQSKLPEGVQAMVNPATGQPMHVMIDKNSGMPIPVNVNTQTGEVTPIVQAPKAQTPLAGESFGADGLPNTDTSVNPGDAPALINPDELGALGGLP